ncbi:MAG: phosphate acyltransferase PlsX [Clostridia bacterium]
MKIVIDVFGGDNAPCAVIDGCAMALDMHDDFSLILSGDEAKINAELKKHKLGMSRLSILHAPDIISCNEIPTMAIKKKKESSLVKALEAVKSGEANCIVSAGSTGALLAGATLIVRRIPGVKRPAIAPLLPTRTGCIMIIDCGANADCKPSYLQQFAVMADAYMRDVMHIENPRIALLNNGAEAEKGNELTKAAHALLIDTPVNFVGNCEARDILSGDYDVLVCDGFVGNVVLKYTEGMAQTLLDMLKQELMSEMRTKIGAALAKPAFKRFKKKLDYTEYGGAPLLGINGGVIKAHGSSDARAFCAAINQARSFILGNVTDVITAGIARLPDVED